MSRDSKRIRNLRVPVSLQVFSAKNIISWGERGSLTRTEFLTILSDPDYMAGVKEKLNMIANFRTAPVAVPA